MVKKTKYYAVRKGHKIGIFTAWHDCLEAILEYPRPSFCAFGSREEALVFMENGVIPCKNKVEENPSRA